MVDSDHHEQMCWAREERAMPASQKFLCPGPPEYAGRFYPQTWPLSPRPWGPRFSVCGPKASQTGMCFSKAWTLFHLPFKSDDSKPWLGLLRGNAVYHLNGLIIYRSSPPPAPFPIRQISILGSAPNKVTQGNFKKLSECNTASINYLCTLDLEIKQQWSVL